MVAYKYIDIAASAHSVHAKCAQTLKGKPTRTELLRCRLLNVLILTLRFVDKFRSPVR